jgi:hypothetical protein
MLLTRALRTKLVGLLGGSALLLARPAHAEPPAACIAENNQAADDRAAHQLLASRDWYSACLAEAECPTTVREECAAALREIKKSIPTLQVAVLDSRRRPVPASFKVDDRDVPLDGSAVDVDPGAHELVASVEGTSTHLRVVIAEGEHERRVELTFSRPLAQGPARGAVGVAANAGPSWLPAYLLGGFAAVAGASFGYFALSGRSGMSKLEECKPACPAEDVRRVRTQYLLADISLGASLAALAGVGYVIYSTPKRTTGQRNNLQLGVAAGAGSLRLQGRF